MCLGTTLRSTYLALMHQGVMDTSFDCQQRQNGSMRVAPGKDLDYAYEEGQWRCLRVSTHGIEKYSLSVATQPVAGKRPNEVWSV